MEKRSFVRKSIIVALFFVLCVSFTLFLAVIDRNTVKASTTTVKLSCGSDNYDLDFYMKDGASIRMSDDTGVRFETYISQNQYDALVEKYKDVEIGTILLLTDYTDGLSEITVETVESVPHVMQSADAGKFIIKDGLIKYQIAIHNIDVKHYDYSFSARSYIKVTDNQDNVYYAYTNYDKDVNSRSISYVANHALNIDYGEYTQSNIAILEKIVNAKKTLVLKENSVVNNTIEGADLTIKGTADSFISVNTDNEIVVPSAVNVVLSNTNHEKNYELSFDVTKEDDIDYTITFLDKNGNIYDGINEYKTVGSITDNGNNTITISALAVSFDAINVNLTSTKPFNIANVTLKEELGLTITKKPAKNILSVGDSFKCDYLASRIHGNVVWASSNSSVATVSNGEIKALSNGKTEITARITEDNVVYEDYFELYVTDNATSKVGLLNESNLSVDFVLNVPTGRDVRILQFTDTQLMDMAQIREGVSLAQSQKNRWSGNTALHDNLFVYMDAVMDKLEAEPDLIVLTGDNIYGKFDDDGTLLDAFIEKMESYGVYWTFTFGNHDKESSIGIENILRKYSNAPHCLYAYNQVTGDSNFSIAIKQGNEYTRLLYLFDTNSTGANIVDTYALVYPGIYKSQIDWYNESLASFKTSTGNSSIKQLAFFHIPLKAFETALSKYGDKSTDVYINDANGADWGESHEAFSIIDSNDDLFNNFKESGVDGIFIGHNHYNNFLINYEGVGLKFGLKTGTYDEFWEGLVGGTLICCNSSSYTVEDVSAINKNEENFDGAVNFTSNQIKTASMWTECWDSQFTISVTNKADELPVGGSGKALKVTTCGDSGANNTWGYTFMKATKLEQGKYYKLSFSLKYLEGAPAYQVKITNGTITGTEVTTSPAKTTDGLFEYNFKATDNIERCGLYFSYWNMVKGESCTFTIDNVKIEEVEFVVNKIENNDGQFEVDANNDFTCTDGNISLYSPTALSLAINSTELRLVKEQENTKINVKSVASHGWSSLYIKFDTRFKQNRKYTISYDAEWTGLDDTNFDMWYRLESKPDTTLTEYNFTNKKKAGIIKDGFTFEFTSPNNYDYLYFRIMTQSNNLFDFNIDNIQIEEEEWSDDKIENNDGCFEVDANDAFVCTDGNISLYSTGALGSWGKDATFKMVKESGNTKINVTTAGSHSWSFLYIKFNNSFKKGYYYTFSFDAEWLGEDTTNFNMFYALETTVGTNNVKGWVESKKNNIIKNGFSFEFNPTSDYDYLYLKIMSQDDNAFNFNVDNIKVEEDNWGLNNGIYSSAGGEFSLFSSRATEITNTDVRWANDSTLTKVTDKSLIAGNSKSAVRVTTKNTERSESGALIKVNKPIKSGKTYAVTYDAKNLLSIDKTTVCYFSVDIGEAQTQMQGYTEVTADGLFREHTVLVFTAKSDNDYFYIRLWDNKTNGLDFTITNIQFTEINGSLEKDGITYNTSAEAGKRTYFVDNGNSVQAITQTNNRTSFVYIKVNKQLVNGQSYTIKYDAEWLGGDYSDYSGNFYWRVMTGEDYATQIKAFSNITNANLFKQGGALTFTSNGDYEYFYLCFHINEQIPLGLNFNISNITVE